MINKMILLIIFQLFFIISPAKEKKDPVISTNEQIIYEPDFSNLKIGKPFAVKYMMPADSLKILEVDINIDAEETDMKIIELNTNDFSMEVTPYSITPYPMPAVIVTFLSQDKTTNQCYTPSFAIPITNNIITETNLSFADIESVYFVWDHLWTLVFIFLLMLFLAWFFMRKSFKKPRSEQSIFKDVDIYKIIYDKLSVLQEKSTKLTDETYKEFFVELSEAVREFLSYTVVALALELPTREVLLQLKDSYPKNIELNEVVTFVLRSADRAKYAKQIFTKERIESVLAESFRMINLVKDQKDMEQNNEL